MNDDLRVRTEARIRATYQRRSTAARELAALDDFYKGVYTVEQIGDDVEAASAALQVALDRRRAMRAYLIEQGLTHRQASALLH